VFKTIKRIGPKWYMWNIWKGCKGVSAIWSSLHVSLMLSWRANKSNNYLGSFVLFFNRRKSIISYDSFNCFLKIAMCHIVVVDSNDIVNHWVWHGKPRLFLKIRPSRSSNLWWSSHSSLADNSLNFGSCNCLYCNSFSNSFCESHNSA